MVSPKPATGYDPTLNYEYCPRCEANLTLQKGYDNRLPFWKCLGCGEMLINPEMDVDSEIIWICDGCEAILNIQLGFDEKNGEWKCRKCGYMNEISAKETYSSDEEYRKELNNPYHGLSDDDLLELSWYEEVGRVGDRGNAFLVRNRETKELFVKKFLCFYDRDIYQYIKEKPLAHMPKIFGLYESTNALFVIEEYIQGTTLEDILYTGSLSEDRALEIACDVCKILGELHDKGIVHRDVKPANIMISPNGEVWLLDMNVAKLYDPEQKYDTWNLGTWPYAAPEQVGYGMTASSPKTDVYAVGILLNVMITGKYPKDVKANMEAWKVIEKCIRLEAEERYDIEDLIIALSTLRKELNDQKENG